MPAGTKRTTPLGPCRAHAQPEDLGADGVKAVSRRRRWRVAPALSPADHRSTKAQLLLGVPGFVATVASWDSPAKLDTSIGVPGPHGFVERLARFVVSAHPRPSLPASRFVTIGRNVPRVEAGCRGEWDYFRFSATAGRCDKVTRRAICAWRPCANCVVQMVWRATPRNETAPLTTTTFRSIVPMKLVKSAASLPGRGDHT